MVMLYMTRGRIITIMSSIILALLMLVLISGLIDTSDKVDAIKDQLDRWEKEDETN